MGVQFAHRIAISSSSSCRYLERPWWMMPEEIVNEVLELRRIMTLAVRLVDWMVSERLR